MNAKQTLVVVDIYVMKRCAEARAKEESQESPRRAKRENRQSLPKKRGWNSQKRTH